MLMKRVDSNYLSLALMYFFLLGCMHFKPPIKVQERQGIQGQVLEQKGNKMPQKARALSKGEGYATQVYIFEPTTIQSAEQLSGSIFKLPSTHLIGVYTTDSIGQFRVQLNPGKYSVFAKYLNGYYAASFNQLNELGIVQVLPGTYTAIDVIISAKASY